MNKKNIYTLVLVIALLYGAINFSNPIQKDLLNFLNYVKSAYKSFIFQVQNSIDMYFFQADEIKRLKIENSYLKKLKVELIEYKNKLHSIKQLCDNNDTINLKKLKIVKTLSYEKFGNFNRIWIDFKDFNSSKVYGLLYKDKVAGIVINKNSQPLALLNRDIKSSYAVFIGDKNAPAIVHGNNEEFLVATYIPAWYDIKVGDEVITSGQDNIFFKGLKVGKVKSVSSTQGYKTAKIIPYFDRSDIDFFYVVLR